jgi:hypothetical protein
MFRHRPARYLIALLLALAVGLCACGRKGKQTESRQPITPTGPPPEAVKDQVTVTYLGQDAFLLYDFDGVRIAIAPHDDRVGYAMEPVVADVVLIGSSQSDREQANAVKGSPRIIDEAGEHTIKGVKIRAIAPAGPGMQEPVYCFELKGVKFCHLRLSRGKISDELAKAIGPVDVLMLPVGSPSVSAELASGLRAWAVVERLKPKVVLPMRYQNDRTKPELGLEPIDPFDEIASKAETDGQREAFVLRGGHSMRISTSNLPQGPMRMVYVLKPW